MNNPIKVLWLDDKADELITDFSQSAKVNRVLIKEYFTNSTEAIEFIRSPDFDLDAIIIDGYFLKKRKSSDKKDITALADTLDELKRILYKKDKKIPFCVFTGYLDEFEHEPLLRDVRIFDKGEENKAMFKYLRSEVAKNEDYQIQIQYDEVFSLFSKDLLPTDKKEDLINILKKVESEAKYNDDDAFNPIRKMYEVVINELHDQALNKDKNQDVVPEALYNHKGDLSILWSWFYLSGMKVKNGGRTILDARSEPVWPSHVSNLTRSMIEIFQENSHDYHEPVRHYTYKSTVFALLELLLWYKDFITNYK